MNTAWYAARIRIHELKRSVPNLRLVTESIDYLGTYRNHGYVHKKTNNNSVAGLPSAEVTYQFSYQ